MGGLTKTRQNKLTTYSGLNSFLKSHEDAKNKLTTKTAAVKNNQTNTKQADAVETEVSHTHQGKWNNINVTYDDETQELTLLGGTEDAPAIMQNGEELEPLSKFMPKVLGDGKTLKQITISGKIKAQGSAVYLFGSLVSLTSIEGLANLDTSEITDMTAMFYGCKSLINLNVSHFDTSKVSDMRNMFNHFPELRVYL